MNNNNKDKVVLFICFREAILNDFNSRFLGRLIDDDFYINYLNFKEYLTEKYRKQFNPRKINFILIRKNMSRFRLFRKVYNIFISTLSVALFIIFKGDKYKYIFVIDYQFNILVFLLELFFFLKRKRIYILQEMYQYGQYPVKYSKLLLKLDYCSQNFAIAIINRNELREEFVNKVNPSVRKKHFTVMNINDNFKYIKKNDKIGDEIGIIYAGGIRKGFLNFIITLCKGLEVGNLSFKIYIYGLDNFEFKNWNDFIDKKFSHLRKYLSINPKVDNEKILSLYQRMNWGIIYYPMGKIATVNEKFAAPCKVFEYINNNLPFISYGSVYCDYLIDKYQIGIKIKTFNDIANLPKKLESDYAEYVYNIRKLQIEDTFSFDKEFEKVRKFLKF